MPSAKAENDQETDLEEVLSPQVLEWLESGEIVLVDVRETSEYEQEHIPGAVLYPLSMFDADIFPAFPNKRVILHCAVGKRSAAAAKQLIKTGYTNVANLSGGLASWKEAGCPTEIQQHGPEGRSDLPMLIVDTDEDASPPAQIRGEGGDLESGSAHPGNILKMEFMSPLGLDESQLSLEIGISEWAVSGIVAGEKSIDAETALRLSRFLCTTDEFWLRLQLAHDLDKAQNDHGEAIKREVRPRRGAGQISDNC